MCLAYDSQGDIGSKALRQRMGNERRRVVDESSAGQFSEVEDRVLLCIYLLSDTTKPAKRELHDDWDSAHTWCSRYVHDGFTLGDGSAQDRPVMQICA
jgi:hypothetical protein